MASSLRSLNSSLPRMAFPATLFPDPVRPSRTSLRSSEDAEELLEKEESWAGVARDNKAVEEDEKKSLVLEEEVEKAVEEDVKESSTLGKEEAAVEE